MSGGDEAQQPEFVIASHYLFEGEGKRVFETLNPEDLPAEPSIGDRRVFDGQEFEVFSILGESRVYWWRPAS